MHHRNAFSIHTFFPSGDPSGLRVVKKDNWSGRAIAFSRNRMDEAMEREDLKGTGVYILRGEEDGKARIYVGEAAVVAKRLKKHADKKDFWADAVAFIRVGDRMDKGEVRYLEARLIQLADAASRCIPDYEQRPDPKGMLEDEKEAAAEGFLEDLLECLRALGIPEFEPEEQIPAAVEIEDAKETGDGEPVDAGMRGAPCDQSDRTLRVVSRGVEAHGHYLSDCRQFEVSSDATAAMDVTPSLNRPEFRRSLELRERLIEEGRLKPDEAQGVRRLHGNYVFSSPSQAEQVLAGRPGSGLLSWPLSEATGTEDPEGEDDDEEDSLDTGPTA